MHERIELVFTENGKSGAFALAITVSLVLHALLVLWFVRAYQPQAVAAPDAPMARYVELMRQPPERAFVESPGPAVERAPATAPLSDANRKATMPEPTGPDPTPRPGDGSGGLFVPRGDRGSEERREAAMQQRTASTRPSVGTAPAERGEAAADGLVAPDAALLEATAAASAANGVDWRSAIREVGKVASLRGEGLDLGNIGGDRGFAEQGPLSFETQWFEWGDYAQSMVSRIRVNWYGQMPQLIRTGIKGVVTIRFTIQRDGRITEITILESSGVPPYDFAARKAIELSSPLNPLPKDFPNASERVTAKFYYNTPIPAR